ncbi:MAG: response regulator, partial [Pirellulales bacterium]
MSQERRVLIVDDCDMNRRIVRKILEADYELQEATDGEEALRAVLEFEPDIVLMDVMMPRMNGYECCRRIKMGPCGEFTQ